MDYAHQEEQVFGAIAVDYALWPLVKVTFPPERPTEHDFDGFMKVMDQLLGVPHVELHDARVVRQQLDAKQRTRLGVARDHAAKLALGGHLGLAATAVVSTSSMVRGVITALEWVRPSPHPYRCFEHLDDGLLWLATICERQGLEVPSLLRRVFDSGRIEIAV